MPKVTTVRKFKKRTQPTGIVSLRSFRSLTAPLPLKMPVKLKYVDAISVNPGVTGAPGVHVFSANSLFDPDFTGIGHQPRGFDQLMTMYDHYTVVGSKIKATFMHLGSTAYNNMAVGINLKDSTAAFTDANDYQEGRVVKWSPLPGSHSTDISAIKTLTLINDTSKFLGIRDVLSSAVCRGSLGSSPSEQVLFHVWAAPFGTSDETVVRISVEIEYSAILTEPKQPTQS